MMAGLIAGGEPRDASLVQQLAEEHICKESCIILLTIACESTPTFYLLQVVWSLIINVNSRL
jgi:hypothetical protein